MDVFGTVNDQTIYLPTTPYQVRLNCKDGGIFVGGSDPECRRTNPKDKTPINIIKVKKFYGDLGLTTNCIWWQLFFVPSPKVDGKILPKNTVCVGYLKNMSISTLNNLTTEIISNEKVDPAMGIFELSFTPHKGELGTYYSVNFEWRQREKDEEAQLKLIKEFWEACRNDLFDLDGTRDMYDISLLSAVEVQSLVESNKHQLEPVQNTSNGKALTGK